MFAGSRWAGGKHVVSFALNADGETNRLDGTVLADNMHRIFHVFSGRKPQRSRVAMSIKLVGC